MSKSDYLPLVPTLKDLGINYQKGLGIFPAGGPPYGGWSYTPGPGFFGKQSMKSLLPRLTGPGSTPSDNLRLFGRKRSYGRRNFGYPLMNRPSASLNESMFPRYPVGDGSTPGGDGGVWMQSGPVNFNTYWGFGRKKTRSQKRSRKSKSRRPRSRKSRKSRRRSRKSRRRSRKSRRRHNPTVHLTTDIKSRSKRRSRRRSRRRSQERYDATEHLISAIKSRDRRQLMIALDNFDESKGWEGDKHPLFKKAEKIYNELK
jgi:hypothetical protein